jgi:effector-binding domain-containing protein
MSLSVQVQWDFQLLQRFTVSHGNFSTSPVQRKGIELHFEGDREKALPSMNTKPEVITTKAQPTAVIHLVIPARDMSKCMDPAIQEILKTLKDQGLQPVGPMFSYHHRRPSDTFDFESGFPVTKAIKPSGGRVVNSTLPAEKVVRSVYQGPYEGLGQAWGELERWVNAQKLNGSGRFWECYLSNPAEVKDPKDYRTELNWVIAK